MAINAGSTALASDFVAASTGSADASKGVKLKSDGRLDSSFLRNMGDGSDGTVTISSPTSLTRDMYYNDLTVSSTLTTAGWRIFVKGTLSGAGTIDFGTPNAGGNASGTTAGTGASIHTGYFSSTGGVNGATGTTGSGANGTNGTTPVAGVGASASNGGGGGQSGNGNGGGSGGTGGTSTVPGELGKIFFNTIAGVIFRLAGVTMFAPAGAAGGAAGGGSGAVTGGGGGGGAESGGIVFICANVWAGTFTIKSLGGTGGTGGNGQNGGTYSGGGGGGGAGGNGGCSVVVYFTKTWSGAYTLTGGTGGTKGNKGTGGTLGSDGSNGSNGATGTSYEIDADNLM